MLRYRDRSESVSVTVSAAYTRRQLINDLKQFVSPSRYERFRFVISMRAIDALLAEGFIAHGTCHKVKSSRNPSIKPPTANASVETELILCIRLKANVENDNLFASWLYLQ